MPTYAYKCDHCEHEFDLFQSITAKTMRKCPECTRLKLRRLIGTGAGIIFKGAGFYETDYRSESYKQGEKKAKKGTDQGKESKKDNKSDTPSTTKDKKSTTTDTKSSSGDKKKSA
jgi:putative FmdB family regulatory protein